MAVNGPNRITGDTDFRGAVSMAAAPTFPPNVGFTNANIATGADIAETKLEHQYTYFYGKAGPAASETVPLGRVRGTSGAVLEVAVGSIVAAVGGATVTVDVKRNGTTILTGVVTLNSGNAARVCVVGTLAASPSPLAADDLLEAVIVATAGGGTLPTGLFVDVRVSEKSA